METLDAAVHAIHQAEALFIGAGAGIGVDSGLPDFRGDRGFWRAYPPFKHLGFSFVDMASPTRFSEDPHLAWGFYGHRLHLYRTTEPHDGFRLLRDWGAQMSHGAFVFTSNVDGQFQRAGFDETQIVECHGSLQHLQCVGGCAAGIWNAQGVTVDVDEETFRARPPLPTCPSCGDLARPNVLMFGDWGWLSERTSRQEANLDEWLSLAESGSLAIVELGAGTGVPTVRWTCERLAGRTGAPLIRINPREAHGPPATLSIQTGALEALTAIDERLAALAS